MYSSKRQMTGKKAMLCLLGAVGLLIMAGCSVISPAPLPPGTGAEEPAQTEELPADEKSAEPETVEIGGVIFGTHTPKLVFSGLTVDEKELEEKLGSFPELREADLRGTGIAAETVSALRSRFPQIRFICDVKLLDRLYSSDLEELDLSGIPMEDTAELEKGLPLFPELKKVILCDCGIPDGEMEALGHRHEEIRFVWTVHFSVYSLRTDASYFCASDVPRLGNVAPELTGPELEPLRYCTDLEALDLGHMNFRDLEFLRDMKKLRYLILVQGKFSDIGVLAEMPDLEYVELFNNNRITDLSPLLNCRKLKHLNIGYCYYAGWQVLSGMPWLERLWMPHVGISEEELAQLQAALPETEIYAPLTDPMGSTGGGWREHPAYYRMRDFFHMDYLPGGTGVQ